MLEVNYNDLIVDEFYMAYFETNDANTNKELFIIQFDGLVDSQIHVVSGATYARIIVWRTVMNDFSVNIDNSRGHEILNRRGRYFELSNSEVERHIIMEAM